MREQESVVVGKSWQLVAELCGNKIKMRRCAGVLMALLLSLSALSAEANKERLRGRRAMAAGRPGYGDEVVEEGEDEGKNTGAANQEVDASAKVVHHEGKKQSVGRAAAATHVMFQEPSRHDGTVAVVPEMMSMDYKTSDVHQHRPINNDAPLYHELVEKP
ncbi:hypothetical protein GUJ93_ZPchr0002g24728 [Zizania palustris]|uniref:Uncharacterized protein n=1 Tax=Zizania palustris TaxID=103762 RepID=A0A8J5SFV3_ZIZPA|nr:hypothetical protein GUJ93_ZPchr0002g24728 [Zizania palustris]